MGSPRSFKERRKDTNRRYYLKRTGQTEGQQQTQEPEDHNMLDVNYW